MQLKLNDIEHHSSSLPAYNQPLEDLRTAQVALAQAWRRTEEEDGAAAAAAAASTVDDEKVIIAEKDRDKNKEVGVSGGAVGSGSGGGGGVGSGFTTGEKDKDQEKDMERDRDRDMLLAKKRREANDRHFERARRSIEEVVVKLEIAAQAMHGVEERTREVWVKSESGGSESESLAS